MLAIEDRDPPPLADDRILVRVHAASVNQVDWHEMNGTPYLVRMVLGWRRPKQPQIGSDFAGTVETVGAAVTAFRPGDEVFGCSGWTFAEFARVRADGTVALKPANLSFVDAAAVGVAGLTALQAVRDHGRVKAGHRVLINGAAGGVGTFATQIAKAYGAHVTGVCGPNNVELVRSLGADRVVDYTREDFTRLGERFDVLIDVAGGGRWSHVRRVLTRRGTVAIVGGPKKNRVIGPFAISAASVLRSWVSPRRSVVFIAAPRQADMETLRDLLEAGTIRPVVERTYPLADVAEAMTYLGTGHARAKLVLTVP
jgi:NADPH:quinone reductase-like Zn-dependent oxidoreductase